MAASRSERIRLLEEFSLSAAVPCHSLRATLVESSEPALEIALRNSELKSVAERMERVQGDVVWYAIPAGARDDFYDVIVVDPPKYAPTASRCRRYWTDIGG